MGFVIASVAGFNPVEIERVGRMSYALTLWAFLQRQEHERVVRLMVERDAIDAAGLTAFAFHEPKKLSHFETAWKARAMGPVVTSETREEMERRADELFAQHQAAMKRRPVS